MSKAKIFYFTLRDEQRKEEKLEWFKNTRFQDIPFERITPDEHGNWINLADTDFKTLLPLANKQTKLAKTKAQENAVFKLFSLGVQRTEMSGCMIRREKFGAKGEALCKGIQPRIEKVQR
jgi:predicted helicase